MNRSFYSLLFYLAMPLVFLRLLWRSIKAPAYRFRWSERLGFYKKSAEQKPSHSIVFHAVSVGEVHAAVPLIKKIQADLPNIGIIITTSTPTGSARVQALFKDTATHVYLPYDLPGAVKRFLDFAKADLLVILETELWPNLLITCQKRGVKVMLANARLSQKSLKNYQKIPKLSGQMMSAIDVVAAQSSEDGEGFICLGLDSKALQITGSMKFDVENDIGQIDRAQTLKDTFEARPVLVAASTREGEEKEVLTAFQMMLKACPNLLLVLVPRHPERFHSVHKQVQEKGLIVVSRSSAQTISSDVQVLLGDSMGEMSFYYGLGDIAFVGGSLVETGCQNIIEPAALGLPVITGPSLFNFKAVSQVLLEAGGMKVVKDSKGLSNIVLELLRDKASFMEMANSAQTAVKMNQGATERLVYLSKQLIQKDYSRKNDSLH